MSVVKRASRCLVADSFFFDQRTPDNLFPSENSLNPPVGWDCRDFIQEIYGGGTRAINRRTVIPSWHPYLNAIWNGTCDAGQLTQAGLLDSVQHGKVSLHFTCPCC
jgi:hypothetical protein